MPAKKWREFIENEWGKYDFLLDFSDESMISYHNETILAFWISRGLLVPNDQKQHTSYEYPCKSGFYVYGTTHKYIGCKEVYGDLAVLYHEENFPGIACEISVLLK